MLAYLKICFIALSFFVALKSASACNTPDYKQAARLDQKKEFSHAFHAFTRLEKGGCPKASYYLGKYYAYGLGTEANDLKALAYYHQFLKNDIKFELTLSIIPKALEYFACLSNIKAYMNWKLEW